MMNIEIKIGYKPCKICDSLNKKECKGEYYSPTKSGRCLYEKKDKVELNYIIAKYNKNDRE